MFGTNIGTLKCFCMEAQGVQYMYLFIPDCAEREAE